MAALPEPNLMPVTPSKALAEAAMRKVVLAGNPNVGKSLFFNAYTGMYVNVSNFPGTTIDVPKGQMDDTTRLMDTPGVYGLSGLSEEEQVAENAILEADIIINVVSAISLSRDLFLTQQMIDYGKPLIVAVNQMDEAEARHLSVDLSRLEKLLGVPVLPTIAVQQQGLNEVREALRTARLGNVTPGSPAPEEIKALEANMAHRMKIYGLRRQHVNALAFQVVTDNSQPGSVRQLLSQRVGQALLNPLVAFLAMLVVLYALYQVIGIWVAGDLVSLTEDVFMLGQNAGAWPGLIPVLQGWIAQVFPTDSFLYTVFGGEFGVLTMSIRYIFGVLFPLVLGFYVYISILEDCGYLPRVAVISDGLLNKIGLNGRAVIPLILGLGCVTMATVSTRVLTSNRERTIASTILAITIPCSAQLGVLIALMAKAGGVRAWAVYIAALFAVLIVMGTILNNMLPGRSSSLILDLPPMRIPNFKNIARKTWVRTVVFLKEAAPLFVLGSLLVAVLQATHLLEAIQNGLGPAIKASLHLPYETAQVFVMGLVRRDFGAAGLYLMADRMSEAQLLTCLMVITLFVPCFASATVIWKERGIKEGLTVLAGSWVIAFGVGALIARLLEMFPVLG
ncbi:ferrous iron transport protein B [Vampirovibrio sp.]|uniref:ferrous iron transport protein B n=1 Tax=Vampirovibrio sp. TaxID=2717857 RepID=UPI003593ECBE